MDERIKKAAEIAHRYGMIDGGHHKQWVIDQMLQAMLGPEEYAKWINEMNTEPGYEDDPWDVGIAP